MSLPDSQTSQTSITDEKDSVFDLEEPVEEKKIGESPLKIYCINTQKVSKEIFEAWQKVPEKNKQKATPTIIKAWIEKHFPSSETPEI